MDLLLKFVEAAAEGAVRAWYFEQGLCETGTRDASVGARAKESSAKAEVGEAVAVRLRDTLDDPVQAKSPKLVGHLAAGKPVNCSAQERCERLAEISVREARWQPGEPQQGAPEGLHFGIAESQGRGALRFDLTRSVELLEGFFCQDAVVGDFLDLQQASIGLKADAPQHGQVVQSFADIEIVRVIDGRLGSQGAVFLVVLLDARPFVVHVERRDHAIGDHPGAKQARCAFGDPTVEDELHLFGAPDIQVFSNHFFKEDSARHRSVQDLGQREFDLQNGEFVPISCLTVSTGEGVRQASKPFPQ